MAKFEESLAKNYEKAKDLYGDLKDIISQNRYNMDISWAVESFSRRMNLTKFEKFENVTLNIKTTESVPSLVIANRNSDAVKANGSEETAETASSKNCIDETSERGYTGDSMEKAKEYKQKYDEEQKKSENQNWIMPVNGRISSDYGWRIHPIDHTKKWHNGIDIAVPLGTIIKAPASGKILSAGIEPKNGKTIRIDHGEINGIRVFSTLIHLNSYCVREGQYIKQGDTIGTVGSTGNSTGPHLHISVYESKCGNDVNPFKYIQK